MSRKTSRQSPNALRTAALRGVFAPTLLCLALFSATSAMATRTGGYDGVPYDNRYGNVESLTGNHVQITDESDGLIAIFGAYSQHETTASVADNHVTISGSNLHGADAFGGSARAGIEARPTSLTTSTNTESAGAISATATGSEVSVLKASTLGNIYGGFAYTIGDLESSATANSNSILVTGDSKVENAFGGYAEADGKGKLTRANARNFYISP